MFWTIKLGNARLTSVKMIRSDVNKVGQEYPLQEKQYI